MANEATFQEIFLPSSGYVNDYKTNANPKINILMSENIGQGRQNFSLEYFDALYYHHFQPNKFKISLNTF